jgi:hypothetical protein
MNEIIAIVPTAYDDEKEEFIEPTNDMQRELFKMVTRKQLHTCGERCHQKQNYDECKYGFPFSIYKNNKAVFNAQNTRWKYHQPRYIDCNVLPYHATLLLLWDAHLNL